MKATAKKLSVLATLALIVLLSTTAYAYGMTMYLIPSQQSITSALSTHRGDNVVLVIGACDVGNAPVFSCRVLDSEGNEVAFALGETCTLRTHIKDNSAHRLQVQNIGAYDHNVCVTTLY
jgi:hypothetical protein